MLVPQGVGKYSAGYFPTHRSLLLVATTPKLGIPGLDELIPSHISYYSLRPIYYLASASVEGAIRSCSKDDAARFHVIAETDRI